MSDGSFLEEPIARIAWLAFIFVLIPTANAAIPYRASALVQLALERNPGLQSAKLTWDLASIDKRNRFYSYFPIFTLQGNGGFAAQSQINQGSPWNSQYSFQASDTLYGPNNNWWVYKEGNLNERFAELSYRLNRDQLLLTLVQDICKYLDQQYQLQINREILKYVQTEFSIIQQSYRQGLKAYSDFLRFKARLFTAQLTVQNLDVSAKKALLDVSTVLNMRDEIGDIQDDLGGLDSPLGSLRDSFLIDELAEFQKRLVDVRTEITKQKYPLEVDLNFGANYGENYGPQSSFAVFSGAGPWESTGMLTVKLYLFDWGAGHRAIEQTRLQQEQLVLSQQATQAQAHNRDGQLSADIGNFEGQLKTLVEVVKVEDENLKQQTVNYRDGKSTFLDYTDALTGVGQARQTYRETQLNLKKLRAESLSLRGLLYEHLVEK